MSLHYNADNIYLLVNGKERIKSKANNKNVNFLIQFCLRSISKGFSASESREVSLNENVYDFSVDYNSIDKSDMLKIHKYLMAQNNIKQYSSLTFYQILVSLWHVTEQNICFQMISHLSLDLLLLM